MRHSELTLETMRFLRNLTNDGLLTGEEVWSLARWLNQHQSACEFWPGNLLIEPLGKAFEDGSLSLEEMRSLAELLAKIEHEWAARLEHEGRKASRRTSKERAMNFPPPSEQTDPALLLPSLDVRVPVTCALSESEYKVDLQDHVCECDEWIVKRQGFPSRSLARCCRHVAEALSNHVSQTNCADWLAAVLHDCHNNGRGLQPDYRWRLLTHPAGTIALARSSNDWVNVFAPAEAGYERFGYNLPEERWSFGTKPPQEKEVLSAIYS